MKTRAVLIFLASFAIFAFLIYNHILSKANILPQKAIVGSMGLALPIALAAVSLTSAIMSRQGFIRYIIGKE